jgi:hypothetical protein
MRFQKTFRRVKPATPPGTTLGGDSLPAGGPAQSSDAIIGARVQGFGQHPPERIVVGCKYTGAGPFVDLNVELWVWDSETASWFKAATGTLKQDELLYLRCPFLVERPQTQANIGTPTSGGTDAYVLVKDPGAAADGAYLFGVGADAASF